MMPDLGKYAVEVYSAYAATFALVGGLVAVTLLQARRASRAMRERGLE